MCLFATHFHELTALASQRPGIVNRHVSAHIDGKQVVMLYSLQEGPCKESFGIHVASMAKFPIEVINEAKRKAKDLESIGADANTEGGEPPRHNNSSVIL
jgi:DNA mismatch repair protein MSH2